jgi:hypothetical protein
MDWIDQCFMGQLKSILTATLGVVAVCDAASVTTHRQVDNLIG